MKLSREFCRKLWFVLEALGVKNLPKLNTVLRFTKSPGTSFPLLPTTATATEVEVKRMTGPGRSERLERHILYMNKPSDILRMLMANPKKADKVTGMPDRTVGSRSSFAQGTQLRRNIVKKLYVCTNLIMNEQVTSGSTHQLSSRQ